MELTPLNAAGGRNKGKRKWDLTGWRAFVFMWLARTMNKMSDSYISSTLSTVERHYGLTTKSMSMVFAGNDVTSIIIVLPLVFYFNQRNKAFWTGVGQVTVALAGLLPLLAYLVIPSVQQSATGGDSQGSQLLCAPNSTQSEETHERGVGVVQVSSLALFFLCKLMMGVASATYWTLGVAYMVDNISSTMVPAALGLCYIAGYLGGFFGSMLASGCLAVGRWWLGWPIMSVLQAVVALGLFSLPANLPVREQGQEHVPGWSKMLVTLRRLFSNKILMFDTFAMVFILFSGSNGAYMAKFIEFQFRVSPSKASLVSGSSKTVGYIVALALSSLVVSVFKPSARALTLYNFLADCVSVVISLSMMAIDCRSSPDLLTPSSCLSSCSCLPTMDPVCDLDTMQAYTSACAAGCSSSSLFTDTISQLNSTVFSACSCTPSTSTSLVQGFCPVDCSASLYYFMAVTFVLAFIMCLGRVGNLLVHIRCVDHDDKALGMAIQEVFIALFAFIPGEVMFGSLVDSSCSLWSREGSCAQYNTQPLRMGLFGGAALASGLAALFDGLVWRGARDLQIY